MGLLNGWLTAECRRSGEAGRRKADLRHATGIGRLLRTVNVKRREFLVGWRENEHGSLNFLPSNAITIIINYDVSR